MKDIESVTNLLIKKAWGPDQTLKEEMLPIVHIT